MSACSRIAAGLSAAIGSTLIAGQALALHAVPPPPLQITRRPEPPSIANWNAPRTSSVGSLSELDAARKELSSVSLNLRKQFRDSPEYVSAISAVKDARQQAQDASKVALAQVRASVEYKTLQIELTKAEQQVDAAHRGSQDYTEISTAARHAAKARAALSKLESDALTADATASTARQSYQDAVMQLRSVIDQFEIGISADPDWRAARARLDTARDMRVARR